MRKLIHEEVDREAVSKSVNVAVKMSKPTVEKFMEALGLFIGKPLEAGAHIVSNKVHPIRGKQSIKTLIGQGQGVASIPLADVGLKDFQKIAKTYGVDFAVVKDKKGEVPVYTVFFKAKDTDAVTQILQDYSEKQLKKSVADRPSILGKLKKFKEMVAALPKKVTERKKERVL